MLRTSCAAAQRAGQCLAHVAAWAARGQSVLQLSCSSTVRLVVHTRFVDRCRLNNPTPGRARFGAALGPPHMAAYQLRRCAQELADAERTLLLGRVRPAGLPAAAQAPSDSAGGSGAPLNGAARGDTWAAEGVALLPAAALSHAEDLV